MSDTQQLFVILFAAVAVVVLWIVRARHREFTAVQLLLWYGAKLIVRVLWRAKQPPWPIAKTQGVVVICNHRSSVDPFFVQTIADRPMRWMVAREYIRGWMGWFLRTVNVIPVGRGGVDTAATKAAIRCAAEGGLVGMLPEGRINVTDEFMLPVRPGAVLVALRARVPILPCYIEGAPYNGTATSPFFMPARVRVIFGEFLDLSPFYDREGEDGMVGDLTRRVVKEIAVLAGKSDFEPRLAGRRWKTPSEGEIDQVASNGQE